MTSGAVTESLPRPAGLGRWPLYYGWVNLGVAAAAMVGTLPGRTQGLGLVTEPLLQDMGLGRVAFAQVNLVATLVGSLFCLGIGRLVDRLGSRLVLTVLAAALGVVVLGMSRVTGLVGLVLFVTLTRGLGQSALSVVSLTMVGKWFAKRLDVAMGVYAVVMSVGFMIAFPVVGGVVQSQGWRSAWAGVGMALLAGLAPFAWLFARRTPEAVGLSIDGETVAAEGPAPPDAAELTGATPGEALRTPAFWVFALSAAVYGLVASGIALFNESVLAEQGFDAGTYYKSLVITALLALLGNFGGGLLSRLWSPRRLLMIAMALLAGALAGLPFVTREIHVVLYAAVMGIAGGFVMVLFFSFWGQAYGRAHLGRIQGLAQILTVLASAVGPLVLAQSMALTGSYAIAFFALAVVVAVLGLLAALVPVPRLASAY